MGASATAICVQTCPRLLLLALTVWTRSRLCSSIDCSEKSFY